MIQTLEILKEAHILMYSIKMILIPCTKGFFKQKELT